MVRAMASGTGASRRVRRRSACGPDGRAGVGRALTFLIARCPDHESGRRRRAIPPPHDKPRRRAIPGPGPHWRLEFACRPSGAADPGAGDAAEGGLQDGPIRTTRSTGFGTVRDDPAFLPSKTGPLAAARALRTPARPACLSRIIEARAAQAPDAIALRFGAGEWTLGTINARANRLARHLRAAGVGPEVLVGVCLPRGPELWISLLAVLKAGGAYLPLDPAMPVDRLAFVLADAGARALLARADLAAGLPMAEPPLAICPFAEAARIAACDDTDPGYAISPRDLAYVIYTSGST